MRCLPGEPSTLENKTEWFFWPHPLLPASVSFFIQLRASSQHADFLPRTQLLGLTILDGKLHGFFDSFCGSDFFTSFLAPVLHA